MSDPTPFLPGGPGDHAVILLILSGLALAAFVEWARGR
jgi:hypothetical protein